MNETVFSSLGRANTMYVFGDSHGIGLDMRVYQVLGKTFAFREMFVPFLRASSLVVKSGELPPKLSEALKKASLTWSVDGVQHPAHTADDSWIRHIAYMRESAHEDPVLLFSIGFIELADFSFELANANESLQDRKALVRRFTKRLRPLARTLLELKARSFNRLALMAIAPFTTSDDAFAAQLANVGATHNVDHVSSDWRKTLYTIGNEALANVAREAGASFIPSLPDHEVNGLAANGVLIDGIHYSQWALDRVAHQVIKLMYDGHEDTPFLAPPDFYQVFLDLDPFTQMTIDSATFEAISGAAPGTILPLQDVNDRSILWTSTSRIRCIVGITH